MAAIVPDNPTVVLPPLLLTGTEPELDPEVALVKVTVTTRDSQGSREIVGGAVGTTVKSSGLSEIVVTFRVTVPTLVMVNV